MNTPHLAWYIQWARFSAADTRVAMQKNAQTKIMDAQSSFIFGIIFLERGFRFCLPTDR
jgi:hypothetical protein